ncbi:hypothetical protein HDU97_008347 [Phlyctochytrium planicorne]|nr:hypothetical protein HDU97_008347 [Phlyctochytrium planicorne]
MKATSRDGDLLSRPTVVFGVQVEYFLIYKQLEKKVPRSKVQLDEDGFIPRVKEIEGKRATSGSKGTCVFMDENEALTKRTITLMLGGQAHHLVSYYLTQDLQQNRLQRPSGDPTLQTITIPLDLINQQTFRKPLKPLHMRDGVLRDLGGIGHPGEDIVYTSDEDAGLEIVGHDRGDGMSGTPSELSSSTGSRDALRLSHQPHATSQERDGNRGARASTISRQGRSKQASSSSSSRHRNRSSHRRHRSTARPLPPDLGGVEMWNLDMSKSHEFYFQMFDHRGPFPFQFDPLNLGCGSGGRHLPTQDVHLLNTAQKLLSPRPQQMAMAMVNWMDASGAGGGMQGGEFDDSGQDLATFGSLKGLFGVDGCMDDFGSSSFRDEDDDVLPGGPGHRFRFDLPGGMDAATAAAPVADVATKSISKHTAEPPQWQDLTKPDTTTGGHAHHFHPTTTIHPPTTPQVPFSPLLASPSPSPNTPPKRQRKLTRFPESYLQWDGFAAAWPISAFHSSPTTHSFDPLIMQGFGLVTATGPWDHLFVAATTGSGVASTPAAPRDHMEMPAAMGMDWMAELQQTLSASTHVPTGSRERHADDAAGSSLAPVLDMEDASPSSTLVKRQSSSSDGSDNAMMEIEKLKRKENTIAM